ncbi:Circadian clock-controlled protein, partial [Acromyrmex echinatior]
IGLPEFDFPPMDPLFYEYGKVMLNSGELRGELIMSNVTAIGLSKARIFNARTQFLSHDVFRLEIGVQMPKLFLKGAAKINGSLSIFRIVNEGNFNITLNDVRALWEITGHVVNDTWIVEQFHITPLIGKFKIYYKDLSESTKEFSDLLINFVNEYWPTIYRTVLPIMAKEWDKFYIDIANRLFAKVSFSKVFP